MIMHPKYPLAFFFFLVKVLNVVLFYAKIIFLETCFFTFGTFLLGGIIFTLDRKCRLKTLVVMVLASIFYFDILAILLYKHIRQELILIFNLLLMVCFGFLIAFHLQIMKLLQVFVQVVPLFSFCLMFENVFLVVQHLV